MKALSLVVALFPLIAGRLWPAATDTQSAPAAAPLSNRYKIEGKDVLDLQSHEKIGRYPIYLYEISQSIRSAWGEILASGQIEPPLDTHAIVTFELNSSGETEIKAIEEDCGKAGVRACVAAIKAGQPYRKWTVKMTQDLGDKQPLVASFFFRKNDRPDRNMRPTSSIWPDDKVVKRYGKAAADISAPPDGIKQPGPVFPYQASFELRSGSVEIVFKISDKGKVYDLAAISSTHRDFEEATIKAVARWQYPKSAGGPFRLTFVFIPAGAGAGDVYWR